jgi:hypothetical protein
MQVLTADFPAVAEAGAGAGAEAAGATTGSVAGNGMDTAAGADTGIRGNGITGAGTGAEAASGAEAAAGGKEEMAEAVIVLATGISSSLIFSGYSSARVCPFLAAPVSAPPHCIYAKSARINNSKKPNNNFI